MRERGLPHVSFPAALGELFIGPRHGVVVVGTHGKTTTSAMMGALLHHAGRDPSFLVGGVTRDFDSNFRLGAGPHFVVEGDEYDTAYFDKGPKFLHYRPRTAIFTSCELDHADIYRDEAHYESAFEKFVGPRSRRTGSSPRARATRASLRIARRARAPVETYAVDGAGRRLGGARARARRRRRALHARPARARRSRDVPPAGRRRAQRRERARRRRGGDRARALARRRSRRGLAAFRGVKRRQEVRGTAGGVDGGGRLRAPPARGRRRRSRRCAARYPGARLLAAFEPRSNTSRRNLHQARVRVARRPGAAPRRCSCSARRRPTGCRRRSGSTSTRSRATSRRGGQPARAFATVDEMVPAIVAAARPGDVVVAMSNGAFGGHLGEAARRGWAGSRPGAWTWSGPRASSATRLAMA